MVLNVINYYFLFYYIFASNVISFNIQERYLVSNSYNFRSYSRSYSIKTSKSDENINPKYKDRFAEMELKSFVPLIELSFPIEVLANKLKKGELNLSPDYQRGYVWSKGRASKLIETILYNRFIPPIVLHEKNDGNCDVIDGKQRLSTILAFLLGSEEGSMYRLPSAAFQLDPDDSDDEKEHELKGLRFKDLTETLQRKFQNYVILVKKVPSNADVEFVFNVYEDINSGADDLTPQQLRRAVFNGPYMTLINKLRENNDFLKIRGEKSIDISKESDGEMILRAFALSNNKVSEYKGPMKKFLNRDCKVMNDKVMIDKIPTENSLKILSDLEDDFKHICSVLLKLFGTDAVCREWGSIITNIIKIIIDLVCHFYHIW